MPHSLRSWFFQMLSKVVTSVSTSASKKTDAELALAKEQKTFDALKVASNTATDEFIAQNLQSEKEKAMIAQIRSMVISLNKGQFTNYASCKDLKASAGYFNHLLLL